MASPAIIRFAIFICVIMMIGSISASNSRPPRNNDINNMVDALRYLQDLDNYYGDKARVRFGKRTPLLLKDGLMEDPYMKESQSKLYFGR